MKETGSPTIHERSKMGRLTATPTSMLIIPVMEKPRTNQNFEDSVLL